MKTQIFDKKKIPSGLYCDGCPFWRHRKDIDNAKYGPQDFGYCLYLGKGDIELNQEDLYILTSPKDHPDFGKKMTSDEIGIPFSLLWDGCKMCGENDQTE